MTRAQKLIGWALFAILLVVLVISSAPDPGRKEGYQGSYLGRNVQGQQANANQAQTLNARAASQRF